MSDNILQQVQNELKKSQREALKGKLKGKVADYQKAREVLLAVEADIVKTLQESGEDAAGIAEILAG